MPGVRSRFALVALAAALAQPAAAPGAPIAMDGPTTDWTAISFSGSIPDWPDDHGTGQDEADIVGDLAHPAFYTAFDDSGTPSLTDGTLAFRLRLGADHGQVGFSKAAAVGIDANLDGALDVFALVNNSGGGGSTPIAIYDAGSGSNTSPSTTTITSAGFAYAATASNYDWSPLTVTIDPTATILDVDGDGNVDHFLSFAIPLQDLVNRLAVLGIANVDQNTPFQYVIGTSTQASALNQDIGGPFDGTNSGSTWEALGATSLVYSASGVQYTPEPGTAFLMGLGLAGLAISRRRLTLR